MPAATLHTEAFVLARRQTAADGWQACTLFSPGHGPLHVMQRLSGRKAGAQPLLDLFDEAALGLESSNQGRTWFVREARIVARHSSIGRNYEALKEASSFARLIERNPVPPESRESVAALVRTALSAFDGSGRPEIVFFKCLYCFAREEGYPVVQEWFPALDSADRETVAGLLNRPLAQQTASPGDVERIGRLLADYLRGRTDILLD